MTKLNSNMEKPNTVMGDKLAATQSSQSDLASFIDASEFLRRVPISRGTLRNWCNAGKIPFVRLQRRVIFHWPSVEAALLRQQRGDE